MKNKIQGIYILANKITKLSYIGLSIDIKSRLKTHFKNGTILDEHFEEYHKALYKAMRNYGINNFTANILEIVKDVNKLPEREIYWIAYYNTYKNGYNETPGGEGVHDCTGERHHNHKLNEQDVINIRQRWAACNESVQEIYKDFKDKIKYSGFKKIYTWQTWKNILPELNTKENRAWHTINALTLYSQPGELNPRSKLTNKQVQEIRTRHKQGESNTSIYKDFQSTGITYRSFLNVVYKFNYKDLGIIIQD